MAGNVVQIVVEAIDKASSVFKGVGQSSEKATQQAATGMNGVIRNMQKLQTTAVATQQNLVGVYSAFQGMVAAGGMVGIGAIMIKAAKDWGNAVDDIVDITGAAGEEASKLLVVAKATGIGVDEATPAFAKFGKAISTSKDEMKKASAQGKESNDMFSRLGFTLNDLDGKNMYDVFQKVVGVMRNMEDGADKDRAAMELFGKSGYQLHDMLNITDEKMKKVIDKAQQMGLIISSDTASAWEDFDRKLKGVTGTASKLAISMGNELLPVIQEKLDSVSKLNDAYAKLAVEKKQVIVLVAQAAAEFAAFSLACKGLNSVLKPLGIGLTNPWIATIYAIGLAISKMDDYINKAQEAGNIAGQTIYKNAQGGLEAKTGRFEYGPNDNFAAAILPWYPAAKLIGVVSGRRTLTNGEQSNVAAEGVYGEGPAGLGYKPATIKKVDTSAEDAQAKINAVLRDVSPDGGASVENKIAAATEKVRHMVEQLNEKIQAETTSVYDANIKKLQDEIAKSKFELTQAAKDGAPTAKITEAKALLDQYETAYTEKQNRVLKEAQNSAIHQSALIGAQLLDNRAGVAQAEYQITLDQLAKEKREKLLNIEATNSLDKEAKERTVQAKIALEQLYNDKALEANRKRQQAETDGFIAKKNAEQQYYATLGRYTGKTNYNEHQNANYDIMARIQTDLSMVASLTIERRASLMQQLAEAQERQKQLTQKTVFDELDIERQRYDLLKDIAGTSQSVIDGLKRQSLQVSIDALQTELENTGLTAEKRLKLEQDLSTAIRAQREIDGRNLSTAAGEAYKRIKEQTFDYAAVMTGAWNDVFNGIEGNMTKLLQGQQSFADMVKSIWLDISNQIIAAMTKIAVQQYLMPAATGLLSGLFGGGAGAGAAGKDSMPTGGGGIDFEKRAMGGPVAAGKPYIVGEEGPELFVPNYSGGITNNGQLKSLMQGGSSQENQSPRQVIVSMNIHGVKDVQGFRQSRGQMVAEMQSALAGADRYR